MSSEFRLNIEKRQKGKAYFYNVCITYVGDNIEYKNAIMRLSKNYNKPSYCVFELYLTVKFLDRIETEIPDYESGDYAIMYSDCHLEYFSNNALTERSIISFEENKRLKGIGHALLCIILRDVIDNNILKPESVITLEAGATLPGKNMIGLIKYYERLGFKQYLPDSLYLLLNTGSNVPMNAKISDILSSCNKAQYSTDVLKIINEVKI